MPPGTRLRAVDTNATNRPSCETAGWFDGPPGAPPSAATDTCSTRAAAMSRTETWLPSPVGRWTIVSPPSEMNATRLPSPEMLGCDALPAIGWSWAPADTRTVWFVRRSNRSTSSAPPSLSPVKSSAEVYATYRPFAEIDGWWAPGRRPPRLLAETGWRAFVLRSHAYT